MAALCLNSPALFAQEENKKSSTQQIGGLLFDVDEGVKIENGPGGSVYMKSNREYMQQKFADIDAKFAEIAQTLSVIDARLARLEQAQGLAPAPEESASESAPGSRKVLMS